MVNPGLAAENNDSDGTVDKLPTKSNNLIDYMEHSTIHGVKYLGETERSTIEKIFWMTIVMTCIIFMGCFIFEVFIKWKQQTVILVEDKEATSIYSIPFPAVTVCPQVKLKTEHFRYKDFGKVMNVMPLVWNFTNDSEYFEKLKLAQLVCHPETTLNFYEAFSRYNKNTINASHIKLLHDMSPTHDEVFESIQYPMDCELSSNSDLSTKQEKEIGSILTNEGICYTFNVPSDVVRTDGLQTDYLYYNLSSHIQNWDYETGYHGIPAFPITTCSAGFISSLRLQIKSSKVDLNTLCQPTTVGYKVILHSPVSYPNTFEDYISISHNTITRIGVVPKSIKTSENLRSYTPEQRQCYFKGERKLRYFNFYTRVNCKLECFANFTIKAYGCVHFALPTSPDIPICGAIWQNIQYTFEIGENIESIVDHANNFPGMSSRPEENRNMFTCGCLPECNSIQYDYTVEAEAYDYEKLHDEIYEIFAENGTESSLPTKIVVYWKDFRFIGETRKQLYTLADLVSNFGGLLGLFMGGSILSLVEIFYFCIVRKYLMFREQYCNS